MKKIIYVLLVTIFIIPLNSSGQRWKEERLSVVFGTGTSHFLGDLGGGKKEAAHFFGVRDLDFVTTRPTGQIGVRYRFYEELYARATFTYTLLSSRDDASQEINRKLRNLSFRSHVWDLGAQVEYTFIKEKPAPRYAFNSLSKARQISAFLIVGGGGLYYNPQAYFDGEWVNLRPLGTEGQGHVESYDFIDPNTREEATQKVPKQYGKFTWQATIGLGLKYNLNRFWAIGLDVTNRYTGSDYIDDAHDRYFNFAQEGIDNPLGAELADRQLASITDVDGNKTVGDDRAPWDTGQPYRGDPDYNDAFILTILSAHYKFKNTMKGMPKF